MAGLTGVGGGLDSGEGREGTGLQLWYPLPSPHPSPHPPQSSWDQGQHLDSSRREFTQAPSLSTCCARTVNKIANDL